MAEMFTYCRFKWLTVTYKWCTPQNCCFWNVFGFRSSRELLSSLKWGLNGVQFSFRVFILCSLPLFLVFDFMVSMHAFGLPNLTIFHTRRFSLSLCCCCKLCFFLRKSFVFLLSSATNFFELVPLSKKLMAYASENLFGRHFQLQFRRQTTQAWLTDRWSLSSILMTHIHTTPLHRRAMIAARRPSGPQLVLKTPCQVVLNECSQCRQFHRLCRKRHLFFLHIKTNLRYSWSLKHQVRIAYQRIDIWRLI